MKQLREQINVRDYEALRKLDWSNISLSLMYSGGYDSTMVLHWAYEVLKEVSAAEINLYSIVHPQTGDKNLVEIEVRDKFIQYLDPNIEKIKIHQVVVPTESFVDFCYTDGSLPQFATFLMHTITQLQGRSNSKLRHIILTGHHRGDDFFTFDAYRSFIKMVESVGKLYGKKIMLAHPLKFNFKREIVAYIDEHDLSKYVWTCEMPVKTDDGWKPCGKCNSCLALNEVKQ
jgi:7-cyano-7-deazaguanine synthase in queuosine biosynthesis